MHKDNKVKKQRVIFIFFIIVAFFVSLELVCQIGMMLLFRRWNAILYNPKYYYQRSNNHALAYEFKRNISLTEGRQRSHINKFGIRDDSDDLGEGKNRIGLLGDSAVFGIGLSQEDTLSASLQAILEKNEHVKVLNFGVPGYGLSELRSYLESIYPVYKPHKVIYILNLNDFTLRNTIYEGADNGLYRMYVHPVSKLPWIIGKLIYRLQKGNALVSVRWYKWLFNGTRQKNLLCLSDMAHFARLYNFEFYVVFLPVRSAYVSGSYALKEINREISDFLDTLGIKCINPVGRFGNGPQLYFDKTDHLTREGCKLMARIIRDEFFEIKSKNTF